MQSNYSNHCLIPSQWDEENDRKMIILIDGNQCT